MERWNAGRGWKARLNDKLQGGSGVALPVEAPNAVSAWHLYVIRAVQRDALRDHLARRGISTGIHYPVPIHLQPAYQNLGYKRGDFPVTEGCAERILSLPMYAELTHQQLELVAGSILEFPLTDAQRQVSANEEMPQANSA